MSEQNGNGEKPIDERIRETSDVREIPTGDLIAALFFCLNNEFGLVGKLEMMTMAPPQQQAIIQFQAEFKDSQKKLAEVKEAREKIVAEFNERYASTDAMRRALIIGDNGEESSLTQ